MQKFLQKLEKPALLVGLLVTFRLLLDFSYFHYISVVFGYSGYHFDFNAFKYIESWLLTILVIWLVPKKLVKVSDYLMFTLAYGMLLPVFSYYGLNNQSREFLWLILLCVGLIHVFRNGKPFKLPTVRHGKQIAYSLVVSFVVVVTFWFIFRNGLRYFNLDFAAVYDFRSDVSDSAYVGVMSYIITWATKVVGPALMGLALYRKQYFVALLVIGLHILWFGFSSHKAVFFYPYLIVGLWLWFRNYRSFSPLMLVIISILLVSLGLWWFWDETLWASMFVRRVFFSIAKNTFDYFIFFSEGPKVYWSNSLTADFIDYPYYVGPARLIGHWRDTESHVNNSFISTAYMHAGIYGIVLYGVLVGLLFRLLDSLASNHLNVLLVLSAILVPSRSLILSADLPTAFLTHGIGFAIIIAFLLRGRLPAPPGK